MSNEKAVSIPNIWSEVHFGMMDCNNGKMLEEFQNTFSKVMMPALKSQEVAHTPDHSQCSAFDGEN